MSETDQLHDQEGSATSNGKTCCAPVQRPATAAIDEDVTLLSTLANETRYEAVRVLAASERELCACEIEGALPVSQSAVSQALGALYAAGLVERRKDGRWRYYRTTEATNRLIETIDSLRKDHQ